MVRKIQTTAHGRIAVAPSPRLVFSVKTSYPISVRLWVGEWFNRERVSYPIYISYVKEDCNPGKGTLLPMDSTLVKFNLNPGDEIWACSEDTCLLCYAADPII